MSQRGAHLMPVVAVASLFPWILGAHLGVVAEGTSHAPATGDWQWLVAAAIILLLIFEETSPALGMRRTILFVLALGVTGFFLWYFGREVARDWDNMQQAFAQGDWIWLAPATTMILLVFVLKGFRWQIIMNPLAKPGYWPLFSTTSIGFMANCILPLRLGELIRPAVLGVKYGVSTTGALATVVVERLFDMLGIVVVSLIGVTWLALRAQGHTAESRGVIIGALVLAAIAVVGIASLIVLRLRPNWAKGLALFALRFMPGSMRRRGESMLDSFISGLTVIRTWRQGIAVFALSVLHWGMYGTMAWLTSLCFLRQTFVDAAGHTQRFDLGIFGAFLVQAFQSVAVSLPQAPGFLGTHQAATAAATKIVLGPSSEAIAGAYAIVLWCVSVLPVILLGFVCLWFEGLSMRQVTHMAGEQSHD